MREADRAREEGREGGCFCLTPALRGLLHRHALEHVHSVTNTVYALAGKKLIKCNYRFIDMHTYCGHIKLHCLRCTCVCLCVSVFVPVCVLVCVSVCVCVCMDYVMGQCWDLCVKRDCTSCDTYTLTAITQYRTCVCACMCVCACI